MNDVGVAAPRSRRLRADLPLLLVAVISGSAFVAQRLGMTEVGPFAFNTTRFAVGSLTLIPVLGRARLRFPSWDELRSRGTTGRASLRRREPSASRPYLYDGRLCTTAGEAGFITGLYVVIVPLLLALAWGEWAGWTSCLGAGSGQPGSSSSAERGTPARSGRRMGGRQRPDVGPPRHRHWACRTGARSPAPGFPPIRDGCPAQSTRGPRPRARNLGRASSGYPGHPVRRYPLPRPGVHHPGRCPAAHHADARGDHPEHRVRLRGPRRLARTGRVSIRGVAPGLRTTDPCITFQKPPFGWCSHRMDPRPQIGASAAVKQALHVERRVKCLPSSVTRFSFTRSEQ